MEGRHQRGFVSPSRVPAPSLPTAAKKGEHVFSNGRTVTDHILDLHRHLPRTSRKGLIRNTCHRRCEVCLATEVTPSTRVDVQAEIQADVYCIQPCEDTIPEFLPGLVGRRREGAFGVVLEDGHFEQPDFNSM